MVLEASGTSAETKQLKAKPKKSRLISVGFFRGDVRFRCAAERMPRFEALALPDYEFCNGEVVAGRELNFG